MAEEVILTKEGKKELEKRLEYLKSSEERCNKNYKWSS